MRILALLTDAYGAGGGIAQYNRDLLDAIARTEYCEEIAVLARHGRMEPSGVPAKVRQLGIHPGKLAFLLRAISMLPQLPRVDVIFCGHLFMLPLAVVLARLCGARVWLQVHGIEAWQRPGSLLRWAVERVQLTTAVSRHTRRRFLQWACCNPASVKVLPNTVAAEFTPGSPPVSLQQRYETRGRRILLTVSRLAASERYKGHDRVIEALVALRASHPDLLYLIAGEGDDKPRLAALVHRHQLEEYVRFIGYVPDEELPDLYRLADVFVMPSSGEGFGIVFLQALAAGLPVVAGDSDGSRDPLRDGTSGYLVDAADVGALAAQIDVALARGKTMATGVFDRKNFATLAAALAATLGNVQARQEQ